MPSWCFISTGFGFCPGTATPGNVLVILVPPASLGENPKTLLDNPSMTHGASSKELYHHLRVPSNDGVISGVIGAEGAATDSAGHGLTVGGGS